MDARNQRRPWFWSPWVWGIGGSVIVLLGIKMLLNEINPIRSSAELVGRYTLTQNEERDILDIFSNHQYVHYRYGVPGQRVMVDSGSWRYRKAEEFSENDLIELTQFRQWAHSKLDSLLFGADSSPGDLVAPVTRSITGQLRLVVDDDAGLYFVHQGHSARMPVK